MEVAIILGPEPHRAGAPRDVRPGADGAERVSRTPGIPCALARGRGGDGSRRAATGNPTKDAGRLNRLAAEVVGPAEATAAVSRRRDVRAPPPRQRGGVVRRLGVAVAFPNADGSSARSGTSPPRSAGPTFPSACVARMALIASDGAGGYVEESLGEPDADVTLPATVMAGDRVLVYVLPRDSSGNKTRWAGGERIAVSARGPAEIPFEPLDTVGAFAATLTASGAYSVAALVGDSAAAGWPRVLQVVAGPCDPDRCVISGDALGNCKTGTPHALLLQAADRFGNPRSMGGDMIDVVLARATNTTTRSREEDADGGEDVPRRPSGGARVFSGGGGRAR